MSIKRKLISIAIAMTIAIIGLMGLNQYTQKQTRQLNTTRFTLTTLEKGLLQLRRDEKDFLLRSNTKYLEAHNQHFELQQQTGQQLQQLLEILQIEQQDFISYQNALLVYKKRFEELANNLQQQGLSETQGIRGQLRQAAKQLEQSLASQQPELIILLLNLRRNEKDFLLRGNIKYQQTFLANTQQLERLLVANQQSDLIPVLQQYSQQFQSLISQQQASGLDASSGLRGKLRSAAATASKEMSTLEKQLNQLIAEKIQYELWLNLVLAIFVAAILTLCTLTIALNISSRLANLQSRMQEIAGGGGDLSSQLQIKGNDEVACVARSFNAFVSNLRNMCQQVTGATGELQQASNRGAAVAEQTRKECAKQQEEVQQVAAAINQMTASVEEVAQNTANASSVSAEAVHHSRQGLALAENSANSIQHISQQTQQASVNARQLQVDAEAIVQVLEVIQTIAEQTNLLALNAAIEAARAGESGRGFAVVADEVRTLASRTRESTQEIQQIIEKVHSGVENTVSAISTSLQSAEEGAGNISKTTEALKTIEKSVDHIEQMNQQIASSAEEQRCVSEEINRNMNNIAQLAGDTANGAQETAAVGAQLAGLANDLKGLVGGYKT